MPVAFSFSWHLSAEAKKLLACINQRSPLPFLLIWPSYQHLPTTTGFMCFLSRLPWSCLRSVCRGEVCIKDIYIYMILLFHWTIAYCKATKRIGTLNFTNLNLPFVVINLLMVCLSIAGHTTQGHTGCQKHVCLLLGLILVTSNAVACSVKENMWHWVFQWFCASQQILCQHRCACHLVLVTSMFKFGSWVDVVTSADDKILCQIVVCLWGKAHMGSADDFNSLMYFLALRISTRCLPVISFVGLPTILPKMKVVAIVYFSWI